MIDLRRLERIARRFTLSNEEAEDVVQDVLASAVEQGRALDGPAFPAWATGAIRRRAAFLARSAGRRRRREQMEVGRMTAPITPRFPLRFVETLPASLRKVARLINAGLDRREIAYLLSLNDEALRQRLSALKMRWRRSGLGFDEVQERADLPYGLMRRAVRRGLIGAGDTAMGAHDPDGHLLIISPTPSRNGRPRQQGTSTQP